MKGGLNAILRAFSMPSKDAYKITKLELGNDTGGEDPPVPITYKTPLREFNKVMEYDLRYTNFSVDEYKTLQLVLTLEGTELLGDSTDIIEFSSIRLLCSNGDVFAWRRFPHNIIVAGYRVVLEWDLVLDEMCWNSNIEDIDT